MQPEMFLRFLISKLLSLWAKGRKLRDVYKRQVTYMQVAVTNTIVCIGKCGCIFAFLQLNVFFVDGDAACLPEFFAPGEVDRIYINFCDPWP